ncbi:MAG: hypothetical protein QOJ98_3377 [Acidobacteriota bacterium]|jgi:hypothetical protein|nr:hypothetical protein [Acidobacteriota bacterium]
MLERRRADDEHPLDAEKGGHDLGRCDGLDGLAESHLVADERAAGAGREQRPFLLIVVQVHGEQTVETAAANPVRERFGDRFRAPCRIANFGDEGKHVVVDAQVGVDLFRGGDEAVEPCESIRRQTAGLVEVARHQATQRLRTVAARAKQDMTLRAVLDADAAVWRLIAREKRAFRSAPRQERRQRELDVLARAEVVGPEIGAGTVVPARLGAANGHPMHAAASRIRHPVIREDRMLADVLDAKRLLAGELFPQPPLPLLERHLLRPVKPRNARFRLRLRATSAGGYGSFHGEKVYCRSAARIFRMASVWVSQSRNPAMNDGDRPGITTLSVIST